MSSNLGAFYFAKPRDSLELDNFRSLLHQADVQPANKPEPVNPERPDTNNQQAAQPEVQPFRYSPPKETPQINEQPNQESILPIKPLVLDSVKVEKKVNSRYQEYDENENIDANDESEVGHSEDSPVKKTTLAASTRNSNDLSQIVAKQLQASTDTLNRLKVELNISPPRDTKNKELTLEDVKTSLF